MNLPGSLCCIKTQHLVARETNTDHVDIMLVELYKKGN